jgi:hypothetical protein
MVLQRGSDMDHAWADVDRTDSPAVMPGMKNRITRPDERDMVVQPYDVAGFSRLRMNLLNGADSGDCQRTPDLATDQLADLAWAGIRARADQEHRAILFANPPS